MNGTVRKGGNMKVIRQLLKGSMKYFVLCILAGVLFTVCELVIPQILRVSVDSVIGDSKPDIPAFLLSALDSVGGIAAVRANMWSLALLVLLFGGLSAVFRYAMNMYNAKAGETLVKTGRDLLYGHIQRLPWSWHSENPTGDIIQRCTSDIERIKTFFQEQFVAVFRIVILIVLSLVCMIAMNFKLSLVALIMFPIIILYSWLFHNRIRDRFTDCDENEGVLSTIAQENLTGIRVVRAFGQEDFERRRFDAQNEHYTSLWIKLCRTLGSFWAVGDLTSCLQVMLTVIFGSVLCVKGEMSAGEFISFTVYNSMLINPVRRLGRMISEMSKAGVSVSRIADVLLAPTEKDAENAEAAPMTGDIEFKNVSFAYKDGDEVLKDLSFTVQVVIFLVVSICLLVFTRKIFVEKLHAGSEKTNVDALIGEKAIVVSPIHPYEVGQVKVGGQVWSAVGENPDEDFAVDRLVRIKAIEGVKVIVSPAEDDTDD